jgi:hypothetical protein
MAWLTSLLKKPEPVEVVEEAPPPPPPAATGPELAVLVPDMAGISSFRLHRLPSAAAAADHIISLRTEVRQGTHAFWALHEKPIVNDSVHVEALVLIRAAANSDLVYVVSFLDIESALSFTRFEVRRGLQLSHVMIYWAAFVKIREEFDGVSLHPAVAPSTRATLTAPVRERSEEIAEPEVEASVATAEPAPETGVITPVEAEAREAVERYLQEHEEADDRRAGIVIEDSAAIAEPPARILEPPPAQPAPAPEPEFAPEPDLAPDTEFDEGLDEADVADVPMIFRHSVVEKAAVTDALLVQGAEDGLLVEEEPEYVGEVETYAADEETLDSIQLRAGTVQLDPETKVGGAEVITSAPIETFPGDEERESFRPAVAEPAPSPDPAADLPDTPRLDDFDIAYEVQRFLQNRRARAEKHDGPFDGFRSPPGRF